MKYKKSMIMLILAIFLFGVASVCAGDVNDTAIAGENDSAIELSPDNDEIMAMDENKDVLGENEKTFGDLNTTINGNADRDICLNYDYKYSESDSAFKEGIVIGRDVNVYGNGHTINGNNQARIFKINSGNVVFYNITFANGNIEGNNYGGAIYGKCSAVNCTFTQNHAYTGGAIVYGYAVNCTFTGNTATYGGAMGDGSAVDCTFIGNSAEVEGGAIVYGSAVNCTFTGNAAAYGGAMFGGYAVNYIGQDGDYQDCYVLSLSFNGDDFTSTYNSDKKFRIYLKGQGGEVKLINVDVVIFKDGVAVRSYSCLSGDGLIFDLAADNYTAELKIIYPGLDPNPKNITLTINKATPKIEVTANEATYPDDVVVNVKSDVGGEYTVKVANQSQIITLESNVTKNITFTGLAANEDGYVVNVTHDSENYTGFNDTAKAIVHRATPKIEVTANEAAYPNVIINVKTDVGGEYQIKVGEKTQIVTLEANVAKDIAFTGLAVNEEGYVVNVTNNDIENCTGFNDTAKAVVHKATPKIEVSVNEATYPDDVIVSVKSDVNGTYVVIVGDKTQSITLEAGVEQKITFTGLAVNEEGYIVNVTYNETENYTSSINDTAIVKVNKDMVKIAVAGITATYGTNNDLVIKLTDSRGNILSGVNVIVNLNGAKTYTTDNNGQVKVTTKGLAPKTYNVVISFDGNANYTKTNQTTKVTVKKATPKMTAKKKTFKRTVKTKKYTIVLKDNTGKAMNKVKVTLKIKGKKTITVKTNAKGKATFKIKKLTKKGKYKATVTFKGNKYYNKVTKTVKITVR